MLLQKKYHCRIAETWFSWSQSDLDSNSSSATYYLWDFKKGTWSLWNLAFFICKPEKNTTYSWGYWCLNKIIYIYLLTPYRPSINANATSCFPSLLKLVSPLWYCYLRLPKLSKATKLHKFLQKAYIQKSQALSFYFNCQITFWDYHSVLPYTASH